LLAKIQEKMKFIGIIHKKTLSKGMPRIQKSNTLEYINWSHLTNVKIVDRTL
jgi:hypothetical protein